MNVDNSSGPSRQFVNNVAANFAGAILPIVIALFTVPIYIHVIGHERYGVVLLVGVLLGYLGFFDFGLGRAATNAIARMATQGDTEAVGRLFWTILAVNLCLGAVAGLAMYLFSHYAIGQLISMPPQLLGEVRGSALFLSLILFQNIVMGTATGTIEAHEKFVALNTVQAFGNALGQILPLTAALTFGASLGPIIGAMLLTRTLLCIAVFVLALRVMPALPPLRATRFEFAEVRALTRFGWWVTLTNVISPLMANFDQVLIGKLMGVGWVPRYAVPMNMIQRAMIFPAVLERALFPRLSRESAANREVIRQRSLAALCSLLTPVMVGVIVLASPLLNLWLGRGFGEVSGPIMQVLAVGAWFNGLGYVLLTTLQAQGRPGTVARLHLAEFIPYIAVLYLCVSHWGIYGAALAWAARTIGDCLGLAWLNGLRLPTAAPVAHGAGAIALAFLLVFCLQPSPPLALALAVALCIGFVLVDARRNPDQRLALAVVRERLGW